MSGFLAHGRNCSKLKVCDVSKGSAKIIKSCSCGISCISRSDVCKPGYTGQFKLFSNRFIVHSLTKWFMMHCKSVSRNVYTYLHKHFTFPFGGVVWSGTHAVVPPID